MQATADYWTAALERIDQRLRSVRGTEDEVFMQVERLARLEMFARACLLMQDGDKPNGEERKTESEKIAPEW